MEHQEIENKGNQLKFGWKAGGKEKIFEGEVNDLKVDMAGQTPAGELMGSMAFQNQVGLKSKPVSGLEAAKGSLEDIGLKNLNKLAKEGSSMVDFNMADFKYPLDSRSQLPGAGNEPRNLGQMLIKPGSSKVCMMDKLKNDEKTLESSDDDDDDDEGKLVIDEDNEPPEIPQTLDFGLTQPETLKPVVGILGDLSGSPHQSKSLKKSNKSLTSKNVENQSKIKESEAENGVNSGMFEAKPNQSKVGTSGNDATLPRLSKLLKQSNMKKVYLINVHPSTSKYVKLQPLKVDSQAVQMIIPQLVKVAKTIPNEAVLGNYAGFPHLNKIVRKHENKKTSFDSTQPLISKSVPLQPPQVDNQVTTRVNNTITQVELPRLVKLSNKPDITKVYLINVQPSNSKCGELQPLNMDNTVTPNIVQVGGSAQNEVILGNYAGFPHLNKIVRKYENKKTGSENAQPLTSKYGKSQPPTVGGQAATNLIFNTPQVAAALENCSKLPQLTNATSLTSIQPSTSKSPNLLINNVSSQVVRVVNQSEITPGINILLHQNDLVMKNTIFVTGHKFNSYIIYQYFCKVGRVHKIKFFAEGDRTLITYFYAEDAALAINRYHNITKYGHKLSVTWALRCIALDKVIAVLGGEEE